MRPIRITLVDDNEDSLDILKFYAGQLSGFQIVAVCQNGEELIDSVMHYDTDVILLDINMPKLNGMDAIRNCLKIKSELLFIFITSYDQYAVEAFELSAVDYLVKPIEKTRLYTALEKARKLLAVSENKPPTAASRIYIKDNLDHYYIPIQDIVMIEKVGGKCEITTTRKTYTTSENISELFKKLPESVFFLSHRSYIVNMRHISHLTTNNQTFLAFFSNTDKYAHISKLKIDELQKRLQAML